MIEIRENQLDVRSYLGLRASVNWKHLSDDQALKAINNSIYNVTAYIDNKLVGMGRIVGDGAVICYIQDLVVHPKYHNIGIGKQLMNKLIEFTQGQVIDGNEIMLCLMSAKDREHFYEGFDFISRPTEKLGPGMIRYIKKSNKGV